MANEDRFTPQVKLTLAKRAANRCSNPDCGAITSGPTADPNDSVNVGEAAHIFGANPGSARYVFDMTPPERSAITNGIWLCGNCHKLIDDDPDKYPSGLLFEWQRAHEQRISEQVGKAGAETRQRYEKRYLEEFGQLSYLAERIILEKGERWEFRLTAEMLRHEMAHVQRRWTALQRGLYAKPIERVDSSAYSVWLSDRLHEITEIVGAFVALLNTEFPRAWGPLGTPGSDIEIVVAARLFAEVCSRTLAWEEQVRFTRVADVYSDVHRHLKGVGGDLFEQAQRVRAFLADVLEAEEKGGTYELKINLTLPPDFAENIVAAMQQAVENLSRSK